MNHKHLKYYRRYSMAAPMVFAWLALTERTKLRKLSMGNRQRDYARLATDVERLDLHRQINSILLESASEWKDYDYGEGYFYQSLDAIGVSGFRDTAARIRSMGLLDRLKGKRVLDVGCNCGFVALSIAPVAEWVVGIEINPYLVRIGRTAQDYLGIENVHLCTTSFEDAELDSVFDVVCSFANHSTYDNLTRHSLEAYFEKCEGLIKTGGYLLFESHAPEYEGDQIEEVVAMVERRFRLEERTVLKDGGFLDRDRIFLVARRR